MIKIKKCYVFNETKINKKNFCVALAKNLFYMFYMVVRRSYRCIMKINSISAMPVRAMNRTSKVKGESVQTTGKFKVVSLSEYLASPLSFGRSDKQAIFYGAECAPFSKKGGVGTVMKDYGLLLDPTNEVVVSPYYGGAKDASGVVAPVKNGNDYALNVGGNLKKVVLVKEKTMQWGDKKDCAIKLFRFDDGTRLDDKDPNSTDKRVHYFIFDDTTSLMKAPYENGSQGNFAYSSGARSKTNAWNGDTYAKNSKAFVEFLPEIIADKSGQGSGFDPATVVCSDSQTALTHEYLAKKVAEGKEDYTDIKSTHIGHNLGDGYSGLTSKQNMFVNLGATPEQIQMVKDDPLYERLGDSYFTPFVSETIDALGDANATMLVLNHVKKGTVPSFSVVAEEYAKAIATNPQATPRIYEAAKELYKSDNTGRFNGIMNPLEDPKVNPTKELPIALYAKEIVKDANGNKIGEKDPEGKGLIYNEDGTIQLDENNKPVIGDTTFEAFEPYPKDATFEQMRDVKNRNKARLLERFFAEDKDFIIGVHGKKAKINAEAEGVYTGNIIKPELINMIKNGEGDKVPLFVSWGRMDTQKGMDIVADAFKEFVKANKDEKDENGNPTENAIKAQNAILIIGAGADGLGPEVDILYKKVTEMLKDPDFQGRVVHIDGWSPGYALASAADVSLVASRFEPCGLTDVESMKYYATPMVVNTHGLAQKNFDIRSTDKGELAKAGSLKTDHEYDISQNLFKKIIEYIEAPAKTAIQSQLERELANEFPVFKIVQKGRVHLTAEGKQIFQDLKNGYDDYTQKMKDNFPTLGFANDQDYQAAFAKRPENQCRDENGKLIDIQGNPIEKGETVNEDGYVIDKDGLLLDENGNVAENATKVDEKGYLLDKDDNKLKDADGKDLRAIKAKTLNWNDWDVLSREYSFKYGIENMFKEENFARKFRDAVLSKELARAMTDYVGLNKDTKTKMFENLKNTKTGWQTNASWHPEDKSSAELYQEKHLDTNTNADKPYCYNKPQEKDLVARTTEQIEGIIGDRQDKSIQSDILKFTVAGLLGAAGALATKALDKNHDGLKGTITNAASRVGGAVQEAAEKAVDNVKEKAADVVEKVKEGAEKVVSGNIDNVKATMQAQIDDLTNQLTEKTNKLTEMQTQIDELTAQLAKKAKTNKHVAIGVAAGAVGAAAITFGVTKLIQKKSEAKKAANAKPEVKVEVKAEQKAEPKVEVKVEPKVATAVETKTAATPAVKTQPAAPSGGVFSSFAQYV